MLLVAGIILMPGSNAALAKGRPPSAAYPTCGGKLDLGPAGRVMTNGGCRLKGKPIPALPRFQYTSIGVGGYSCGVTTGVATGGRFVVGPPGAATASGSVRYLPKGKYRRTLSRPMPFAVTLTGNDDLQCGKLSDVPPNFVPCDRSQWPPGGFPGYLVAQCGRPVPGGLAFSSLPTLVDGVLSAGHVVSPSGRCTYGPWNDLRPERRDIRLLCADDLGAQVVLSYGIVVNSFGWPCPDALMPSYKGQRKMDIPRSWKGTLYVVAHVVTYEHWSLWEDSKRLGFQAETATFKLQGWQEPCWG